MSDTLSCLYLPVLGVVDYCTVSVEPQAAYCRLEVLYYSTSIWYWINPFVEHCLVSYIAFLCCGSNSLFSYREVKKSTVPNGTTLIT